MDKSARFTFQNMAFIPGKRVLLAAVFMFVALCSVILWPLATTAQLNSNSFSPVTWYPSGNATTGSVATGDLNHDGFPDLVVSTQCSEPYGGPACGHTGIFVHLNNGNGTFHLSSTYTTDGDGASPWVSVAIADMNGDGQQDLVILNAANTGANAETVSVMRGNGDGTFQAAASFPLTAGVTARKLTVADVNGDGKRDVIVSDALYNAATNNYRGGVNVLINVGSGSLASPTRYDSGGYASALNVITADVNHDGYPDILVSNDCSTLDVNQVCTGGATIGVLLGNGNGTFQPAGTYSTGGHPYPGYFLIPIAALDLNRDGNADLLVANPHTNQWNPSLPDAATVLIGNGNGSFQPPVHYFDGAQLPVDIVAGDVDGDGLDDAVVLNSCTAGQSCGTTGALSVMLGNANGTLQAPALYYVWAQQDLLGMLPNTVVLADVNIDGKLDVVFATWNSVGVLLNQTPTPTPTPCGNPTWNGFAAATNFGVDIAPVSVTTGDFNGDGRLDIVTANADVASVSLRLGNGSGGFGAATNFAVGAAAYAVASGDLNGDQKLDLVVAGRNANAVFVFLGNGSGGFAAPASFPVGTKPQSVAVGDFNGDGTLDLAVGNFTSNNVSILIGNGGGGFGSATNFAVGTTPFSVATADFNRDGKFDLAVANHNSNNVSVLLGDGSGSFAAATNFAVGGNANSVAVGDFNGDGKKDLAVPTSSNLSVLLGDGAGGFSAATNFGAGAVSVSVGDFDGDGKADLAAVNFDANRVSVLLGNGTGSFGAATNFDVGSGPESIAAGDFNSDGFLDAAVANSNSDNASLLLNNGSTCVTPIDSTPPTLVLPSNITAEATGPSGAAVSYSAAATDNMDLHPSVSCSPSSGSTFALGTNLVQCTATDATGNHASGSFSVTVVDTTPPTLTLPQNMTLDATSPQGALVTFIAGASDIVDLHPTINCTPASGSTFAIQTTVVQCVATDASHNSSQGSFSVTINGASTQTANLVGLVQSFNLAQGITNSLDSKLQNILDAFSATNAGDRANACNQLSAFINSVLAQSGKQLTTAQANQLIAKANQIRAVQGCQ